MWLRCDDGRKQSDVAINAGENPPTKECGNIVVTAMKTIMIIMIILNGGKGGRMRI